jgi:hypothetical protein
MLSVGAEAGINFFGIPTGEGNLRMAPPFADAFARWYPWEGAFFVNLGLGYQGKGSPFVIGDEADVTYGVFHTKAQVGLKFDIGNKGGWIFETRFGFGYTFGGESQIMTITLPVLFGRTF